MAFTDPNITRKNVLQDAHFQQAPRLPDGSPIFSHIEFNIHGSCNRRCVFCPRVDERLFPNLPEGLSVDLYRKILQDLQAITYTGRLSYSGFSEPLYHQQLEELIAASKAVLPGCRVEIVSNGDMVTVKRLRSLFEAGLDALLISMYDGPHQIPRFEAMMREVGVKAERVILRERYLPPEEQFGINLTNRAGMVTMPTLNVQALAEPLQHPCYYTHYRMMVDYNGDVLLCPHDWGKKLIVGNLQHEHVVDIWTGPVMTQIRKRLTVGDRRAPPCNVCDVNGTKQGRTHVEAWQQFYGAV